MDQLSAAAPDAPTRRAGAAAASAITADFQTFLRLLTTQMQNQDPLNPMESTEFASQLAQFSGVEQQVRTNELLTGMQADFATLGMGQIGGWIGMEAQAQMPVTFQGDPVTLSATAHDRADRLELVVRDTRGAIVQRVPVPLGSDRFDWDGTGPSGTPVRPGTYDLTLQSWSGETMLDESPATIHAIVEEARLVDGAVWLRLQGGQSVAAQSILGLRRAP